MQDGIFLTFKGCLVETRNYGILSLAFIASPFRVTEENLLFETVQSGPYSSFECFLCSLRNLHLYFIGQPEKMVSATRSISNNEVQP